MKNRGSTLVEVVVMMFILNVSLVGTYSMIHNAQKLTKATENKLIAANIAKEGIETIETLRDSFKLRLYDVADCFFTINISNLDTTKCYRDGKITKTQYYLLDNQTIAPSSGSQSLPVCINTNGWYSQEFASENIPCDQAPQCDRKIRNGCKTPFTRSIFFENCVDLDLKSCVKTIAQVKWSNPGRKKIQSFILEQVLTKH